jgi:hypothetical protein
MFNKKREVTADVTAATDSLTADAPAGGTGATAGAYDTAANRDLMIATVNGLNATVASLLVEVAALTAANNS